MFADKINIVAICWLIIFIYWLVSAFFVKPSATKYNYKAAIAWRLAIAVIVYAFIKLDKSGAISSFELLLKNFFSYTTLGTIFTVLGLALAIWARIFLGRNWSSYVTYKKEHELVTSGPYRFIRHPIYSGIFLMLLGTFIYYGNLFVFLIFALAAIMFVLRMSREEKIMAEFFGEKYINYIKSSKRLIPWVY